MPFFDGALLIGARNENARDVRGVDGLTNGLDAIAAICTATSAAIQDIVVAVICKQNVWY